MTANQETQEERPELLEYVGPLDKMAIYPLYLARCECLDLGMAHYVQDYTGKPIRIYDYAVVDHTIADEKYIVVAFFYKDKSHIALMDYYEEAHQILESFKEQLKRGYGVLMTPYWKRSPAGAWDLFLKPTI